MQPTKAEIEVKRTQILVEETQDLMAKLKVLDLHVKMILFAVGGD